VTNDTIGLLDPIWSVHFKIELCRHPTVDALWTGPPETPNIRGNFLSGCQAIPKACNVYLECFDMQTSSHGGIHRLAVSLLRLLHSGYWRIYQGSIKDKHMVCWQLPVI